MARSTARFPSRGSCGSTLWGLVCLASIALGGCAGEPKTIIDDSLTGLFVTFHMGEIEASRISFRATVVGEQPVTKGPIVLPDEYDEGLSEMETLVVLLPDSFSGSRLKLEAEAFSTDGSLLARAEEGALVVSRSLVNVSLWFRVGYCGDGVCEEHEDPCGCPADCGESICGDGICCAEAGQDPSTCPEDCGTPDCGGVACEVGEICHEEQCLSGCLIDDVLVAPFERNSVLDCLVCQPLESVSSWTEDCGFGEVCVASGCLPGCNVQGRHYDPGEIDSVEPCLSCRPSSSTHQLTPLPEGTGCDDADYCTEGTTCDANGTCGGGWTWCIGDACTRAVCDGVVRTCSHYPKPPGVECGVGRICDGEGGCIEACFVDEVLYQPGDASPNNVCSACVPLESTQRFTPEDAHPVWETLSLTTASLEAPWTAPSMATEILVQAWGAGGGGGGGGLHRAGGDGGGGGYVEAQVAVTPGETLTLLVAGGGGGGRYNSQTHAVGTGGGGGGYTAVFRGAEPLIVAAGGGGGGGGDNQTGTTPDGGPGGAGGGSEGESGGDAGPSGDDSVEGGHGGMLEAAGEPGGGTTDETSPAAPGDAFSGGHGGSPMPADVLPAGGAGGMNGGAQGGLSKASSTGTVMGRPGGGGGGGGFFGGGGGEGANAQFSSGAGGGGGSSFSLSEAISIHGGVGREPGGGDIEERAGDAGRGGGGGDSGESGHAGNDGRLIITFVSSCE